MLTLANLTGASFFIMIICTTELDALRVGPTVLRERLI
jgi:hypothetical protein